MTISVITVCFNAEATIEETLRSVVSQADASVEYIVVDGKSTDGTLAVIERYRDHVTRLVSERDAGIFDAMNKGVALSTGDVLYFLNADDSFVDEFVLRDISKAFAENASRFLIYGNLIFKGAPEGMVYGPAKAFSRWSVREFLNNWFCHQAIFARRSLFDRIGTFDTRSKYSADYEWVIKAFKECPRGFHHVDRLIANYFYQGRSFANAEVTSREVRGFYLKYLRSPYTAWYYFRYVFLRRLKQNLSSPR